MDKEFIKNIFEQKRRDDRLIKYGDLIDEETIEILKKLNESAIEKAFYQYTRSEVISSNSRYMIRLKCPICGGMQTKEVNKADLLDIIRRIKKNGYIRFEDGMERYLCDDCYDSYIEEKENEKKIQLDVREWITNYYICEYLSPDRHWGKEVKPCNKIKLIMKPSTYESEQPYYNEVEKRIKPMKYRDFLRTPCWDGVRSYKLKKSNYCCELCGGKGVLNVHHKSYENHGKEFDMEIADRDLIVLCKDCHAKFHDKLAGK